MSKRLQVGSPPFCRSPIAGGQIPPQFLASAVAPQFSIVVKRNIFFMTILLVHHMIVLVELMVLM